MSSSPQVSIIIPVYNAAAHIDKTLRSAIGQTWPNKQIIAVNDGSTDNSLQILRSYQAEGVIVVNQLNKGATAAKQAGLELATGQFVQYLDADDILDPDKLTIQVKALNHQPGKIAVCKTTHFFDDKNYLVDNYPDDDRFFEQYLDDPLNFLIKLYGGFDLMGGMIQPNAFLTPMNVIKAAGPWNPAISPCTDEDGEYFTRVILHSKGIVYQPQALNYYRKSAKKLTLSGQFTETTCSNLIDSIWLKHQHLLQAAANAGQVTNIHNLTNFFLDRVKVKVYFSSPKMVGKINALQQQLSPALQPRHDTLGGNLIKNIWLESRPALAASLS